MYRIGEEEIEALREVIASKMLFRLGDPAQGHTQQVDRFEREWAETVGTDYALLVSGGGTAALVTALVGLGIGPGDEVIVPAYTFMATAAAVLLAGAIPVLAEIDETMTIDPGDFARKITPQTKAVIPVHIVGRAANMERILEIARVHGVKVVEDCCQMDGGSYRGRRVGTWGDAGAFSFNDFKILSCGEGGALVTNNRIIYERALVYHDSGANFRSYANELSEPVFLGPQLRASEIMGAILRVQLKRLEGILADLRHIRKTFEAELDGVSGLRFAPNNDLEGDCGVVAAFQFDTQDAAKAFAAAPGVGGWLPIYSDKHVYTNWTPVWEKRVGHRPDVNPYNHPRNQGLGTDYAPDMCPRTLDILARTVFISLHPDWDDGTVAARIAVCRKAAKG